MKIREIFSENPQKNLFNSNIFKMALTAHLSKRLTKCCCCLEGFGLRSKQLLDSSSGVAAKMKLFIDEAYEKESGLHSELGTLDRFYPDFQFIPTFFSDFFCFFFVEIFLK